jgi:alanine-synthesizing transaminase
MFSKRTQWNLSTNRYTEAVEAHRRTGSQLLDLSASNPTTVGLKYEHDKILAAVASPLAFTYDPIAKGLLSARESVANYYRSLGAILDPAQLVLTTSTSEAYTFSFRLLCEPGDEVLVPTPSYPLFDFLAELQDVHLVPYELIYDHGWQIDFHGLTRKLSDRSRAIIVVHPNNPTGSFVKAHEVQQLAELCRSREMAIIADEVFLDYTIIEKGKTFASNQACLTLTMSGLSKISGLPQMKVAWLAVSGPKHLQNETLDRLEIIADTYLSMNAPIQQAVPVLLQERHSIQQQLTDRIRMNLTELDHQLAGQNLVTRLVVEGGWYSILRVPVSRSDEDLAIELIQHHDVLIQPGHFYDFSSDGYLVLSLITPADRFRNGLTRLLRYIVAL